MQFDALVRRHSGHAELECQPFLVHATGFLLPSNPIAQDTVMEERSYFGRADFIVAATLLDDTLREVRKAFVWELKSPQSYLFKHDTNNRCIPTPAFLKGENQLLHYVYQAASDLAFLARMGIKHPNDVTFGGLIIGTRDRMLESSTGRLDLEKAETARTLRENYLYKAHGIRILTWDRIIKYLRPVGTSESLSS